MKRARGEAELMRRLDAGEIVPVALKVWDRCAHRFDREQEVATAMGQTIAVVRWPAGARSRRWAMLEEPGVGERVVRPLPDQAAVKALIAERLAAYERMWDG